ncbi:TetR/AcrR family transcriptional regulator [Oscillibacter valericigenes]|uniref:TetR/AcrR family transcriptional regulator n=1 Tax=Oscillibacter ruminantium TaxID=1263547 RepID=UPI0002DA1C44|nr:TetR/AcrR family transcriptional regulator [Oscillibacter ruminantium]MDN0033620.1 TetR/AcrR family transcriptional regulator [Oscillibacter valericigenes]MEA5042914.1 TetR/AcrR family transcriptional regulator [Oscillibacter ruminantium]
MSRISERRRADILSAALTEFGLRGIEGASMSEIAARAGIGKSTIYEYFPSKTDLFIASCKAKIGQINEQMQSIFATELPFSQQLEAYVNMMQDLAQGVDFNEVLRVFTNTSIQELQLAMEELGDNVADATEQAIRRAQARGELVADLDVAITAAYLLGLPNPHLILRMRRLGRENPVKAMVEMALRGIKADREKTKN